MSNYDLRKDMVADVLFGIVPVLPLKRKQKSSLDILSTIDKQMLSINQNALSPKDRDQVLSELNLKSFHTDWTEELTLGCHTLVGCLHSKLKCEGFFFEHM